MDHLDKLESQSIYIIREAYKQFKDIAVLWSIGKDSTTLMWLIRKAFYGRVPFPALHIDTGYKFKEIYDFRDEWSKKWGMRLVVGTNEQSRNSGMGPNAGDKLSCCGQLKQYFRRVVRTLIESSKCTFISDYCRRGYTTERRPDVLPACTPLLLR